MRMGTPAVRNVHTRRLLASAEAVRPWIERCWSGTDNDPFPRDVIPNWRRNPDGTDPLALIPGTTTMGHGPFAFRLRGWDGAAWRVDVVGADGWHGFDLVAEGDDQCTLTHTLELAGGAMSRLRWAVIEPIHDWAVEVMIDRIERAVVTGVVPPSKATRPLARSAAAALWIARRLPRRRQPARDLDARTA
jgi:hypothetical protein